MQFESYIDRPILNGRDAAEDLLVRMMCLKGDVIPSKMKQQKNLFMSAVIIYTLIKRDAVDGKTNNEVYDAYVYIAKGMNIEPITKDFLMKALKTYYGFRIVSVRKGKKVVRILMTNDSDYSISHSKVKDFVDRFRRSYFLERQTSEVYAEYKVWCEENGVPAVTADAFSKVTKAAYNLNIRSKRKGGKVIRVFTD